MATILDNGLLLEIILFGMATGIDGAQCLCLGQVRKGPL